MEVTVYILRCADGSYYTGLTKQEIEARVWEHNQGDLWRVHQEAAVGGIGVP